MQRVRHGRVALALRGTRRGGVGGSGTLDRPAPERPGSHVHGCGWTLLPQNHTASSRLSNRSRRRGRAAADALRLAERVTEEAPVSVRSGICRRLRMSGRPAGDLDLLQHTDERARRRHACRPALTKGSASTRCPMPLMNSGSRAPRKQRVGPSLDPIVSPTMRLDDRDAGKRGAQWARRPVCYKPRGSLAFVLMSVGAPCAVSLGRTRVSLK